MTTTVDEDNDDGDCSLRGGHQGCQLSDFCRCVRFGAGQSRDLCAARGLHFDAQRSRRCQLRPRVFTRAPDPDDDTGRRPRRDHHRCRIQIAIFYVLFGGGDWWHRHAAQRACAGCARTHGD
ncbi:MAG: hypothetical protein IPK16_09105 [Anaerolineales bacterium]|nr:hypothetical protein [Anaerolineales bacterium]